MAKKKQSKKQNIGVLIGLALAALFAVAAVLFTLVQYKAKIWIAETEFGGFKIAFGDKNSDGNFYFGLIFFFSIIAAAAAVLAALRVLKINGKVLFGVCALLSLGSAIIYLVQYFDTVNSLKSDLVDLSQILTWTFAFWAGFALQVLALLGSAFGAVKSNK